MDRAGTGKENLFTIRNMAPRLLKAIAKTAIAYIIFVGLSTALTPVQSIYNYQSPFTMFFTLYLAFIFIIEITRGTIYQHAFCIANSLMLVVYSSYLLNTCIISLTVEQIALTVDPRFFFYVLVLGGVAGFAKSLLQLLSWINEREERLLGCQIMSL